MKKNRNGRDYAPGLNLPKIFRIMKLFSLFMLACMLHVSAATLAQNTKLNIAGKNMTIEKVMSQIEDQSEFSFFYNAKEVDLSKYVDVDIKDQSIEEVLNELLRGTGLTYTISNKLVVIHQGNESVATSNNQQSEGTVTGTVTDDTGFELPGVTVLEKGTNNGTITDVMGKYTLKVKGDAVLQFSFIGMKSQEISVAGQSVINVKLVAETIGLEEVVAIGYGIQKKSDLTGASSRLTTEDMNKATASSPVEMMQGRVSGVNITQNNGEPGSGMSVRIRGSNSIRSGQEPLYVVDGVPLDNTDLTPEGGGSAGYGGGSNKNPLSFINPDDIETIDILKDASSTAIYGSRGANGVVLITTKKGKAGKGTISYDGYVGIANIREKLDLLTTSEFRSYTKPDGSKLLDLGASTDWQDEIYQSAITQSHNISMGGGSEKFTYQASIGYLDQEGIVKSTDMSKINGSMKVTHKAFDNKVNITGSLIASHVEDTRAPITEAAGSGFEGDLILSALKLNPTFPIKNEDGTYYQHSVSTRNPVAMIDLVDDITQTDRILGNLSVDIQLAKNLNYKLNLGVDQVGS